MKIVLISNLYPNTNEPCRGLYNMHLMQAMREAGHAVEIIAPTAYLPGRDKPPPLTETWNGIPVYHPRYYYTPGFFIQHHWRMYRHAVAPLLRRQTEGQRLKTEDREHSPQRTQRTQSETQDLLSPRRGRDPHPLQKSLQLGRRSPAKRGEGGSSVFSLQSSSPHVILGFIYPDAVAMAGVCRALGLPYSVRVHGSDFRIRMQQPRFRPLIMRCLEQAPQILCPGQALKADIEKAGIDPGKITCFNNGIDPAIFYADGTPRRNEILFVGNLVGVKAPERILAAFHALADLRSGGLRLVMIGAGPMRGGLEQQAARLKIPVDQIEWTGALPQQEVAQRMRQAKVLCLCSRSEGMPNVVTEALACGCPVVATAVGEIPYMLHADNGIIVPPQPGDSATIQSLTAALSQALATPYDPAAIAAGTSEYRWEMAAQRGGEGLGARL